MLLTFLQYLKPKKVDLTPRHKNKGKTHIARKKIIKEQARKVYLSSFKLCKAVTAKIPDLIENRAAHSSC